MKKQTVKNQALILTAIAAIILFGASFAVFAQGGTKKVETAGVGKPFGARDPQPCGDLTGSAPTRAKALNSVICHQEGVNGNYLHLIEDASLQLSAGRPYNMNEDYNVGNIDARAKVYPIRGSFKQYNCLEITDYRRNKGINCSIIDHPQATGLCVKDTWGDWQCSLGDVNFKTTDTEAAPPGGAAADEPQTPTMKNNPAPKNDNKAADKKADDEKTDNNFPKPDFSELEKYVDVIRYEYGDNVTDHNLYIVVKSKANNLPEFCAQFLDKDGIMVDAVDKCGTPFYMGYMSPQAGETAKFDVNMPLGKHMERVVSVRIVAHP